MKKRELLERIEQLEARVHDLEVQVMVLSAKANAPYPYQFDYPPKYTINWNPPASQTVDWAAMPIDWIRLMRTTSMA
jgi:hypothetical protein